MKYICEICNKQHNTPNAAEQCEFMHKKEKAEATAKASAESKISDAINAFIAKYEGLPNIELAEESQAVLLGEAVQLFDGIFRLFSTICDDSDETCSSTAE